MAFSLLEGTMSIILANYDLMDIDIQYVACMFWYSKVKFSGENFSRVATNWENKSKLASLYGITGLPASNCKLKIKIQYLTLTNSKQNSIQFNLSSRGNRMIVLS